MRSNADGCAERFEFIDILANSIPEGSRVVVLDGDDGWSVRNDVLPENSIRLHYSEKPGEISIKDVARAAEALRPDYVIVPNAGDMKKDEYLLYVGHVFSGQIVGVSTFFEAKSEFHEQAEVVVSIIINNRPAPPLAQLLQLAPSSVKNRGISRFSRASTKLWC